MEGVSTVDRMTLRRRDGVWFGVALAVHVAILTLPVSQRFTDPDTPVSVAVSLLRPAPARVASPANELSVPEPVTVSAGKRPPVVVPMHSRSSPGAIEPETPRAPSAYALLESARALKPAPSEPPPRRLGVFKPPPPPANWRPSITVEDNRFSDSYLPTETEVVDRWLAADGSHNVVIRTAGGMTLCGRAQQWNPMQPLVEHVMMFRPCGGGGKRTFTMPERYLRNSRAR
ncbi:MAG: hypothetical protein HKP19_11115 [Xanthomonadales bacterium]|nr:hypothetical protein [Xanthomonadales bacterium]